MKILANFWFAFWDEQVWQVTFSVTPAKTQGFDVTKKAYRLPFSFINKDSKRFNADNLTQAYQFSYKLDNNLKNSVGTYG